MLVKKKQNNNNTLYNTSGSWGDDKTEAGFRDLSSIRLKLALHREIIPVSAESHQMLTCSLTFRSFPSKSSLDSVAIPAE